MDFLLLAAVLLLSIVVHEVAHAWQAKREGDLTAYHQGRITLNPISHIDPVGSILVPLMLWFTGAGFLFGWAKPVPVAPSNFRDYKGGDIRVSLAGIVANLLLALGALLVAAVAVKLQSLTAGGASAGALEFVGLLARYAIIINLILAIFNLIPIPPLDGSHVVYHLLPPALADKYRELGRFGILIVVALLFLVPGAFGILYWPVERLMDLADAFIRLWR